MQTAVVTGASSGIGLATIEALLAAGWRVWGGVRRQADAARLQQALGERFTPLILDVTDGAAIAAAVAAVGTALSGARLDGLVNNAGVAVPGPLELLSLDDYRQQLEVNLLGPLAVTQAFLPLLGADPSRRGKPGRIVMVSSVSGRIALPFVGAYAASKHALEGLSDSLRRELMLYGIDVVIVAPGAVATPIWDKAEAVDVTPFAGTRYGTLLPKFRDLMLKRGRSGLPPQAVAAVIRDALTLARPQARYAVVQTKLVNWVLPRLLPRRLLDRLIALQLGLKPS